MNTLICPEDHDLLALALGEEALSDLSSHLGNCSDCRQRLEQLQVEVSGLRAAMHDVNLPSTGPMGCVPEVPVPSRPATIGKYVVLDVLGSGGQADVYRALHVALGKEVVIKLGRRPLEPGPANRDRLLAEGKVLAELDHPCLARVFDVDEHEGRPFLVMDYVRGRTLRQHAQEQRPTPRQAASLVAQLARALAVAHRRGVVHQDLKPTNILVDEAGQPRVIDFGMARMVHGWVDGRAEPDGGTIAYMAPEQARGETDRINARSDIFALGGVFYFLLTGQAPFRGRDRVDELERASRCDFDRQTLRLAKVPSRLNAICLRAMAAEPADRYARAEDLARDLERFVRRPRQVTALASIAIVGLLAWPAWKEWRSHRTPDGPRPAEPRMHLPADALSVRLFRDGQPRNLQDAHALANVVPFRKGDELRVSAPAPAGLHASLFLIGSTGAIEHLADAEPGELLSYPAGAGAFAPLDDRPGTEVLLVCWRRSGPVGVEEIRGLWRSDQEWPALPVASVLRLDRGAVEVVQKGRPLGPARSRSDPEGDVRARLEQLRLRLADRVDFLAGVAFAHRDSSTD